MKGDFSRVSFDPCKHYSSVRMQQGRVQIDADWNEQMDINDYRNRLFTENFLGGTVGPLDAGFAISTAPDQQNLNIGLGNYYVNGLLVENDNAVNFTNQPDYPNAILPSVDGVYLMYLDAWQQNISMVYDVSITERALSGADTATRVRHVAQVKPFMVNHTEGIDSLTYSALFNINAPSGSSAYLNATEWAAVTDRLPFAKNNITQLTPHVTILSSSSNQIYHVQIQQSGDSNQARFIWTTDMVNITQIMPTSTTVNKLTMAITPTPPYAVGQILLLSNLARNASGQPSDSVQITEVDDTGLMLTVTGAISADIIVPNGAIAQRLSIADITQVMAINKGVYTITIDAQPDVAFSCYQWLNLTTPARQTNGLTGDLVQITSVDNSGLELTVSGDVGTDITLANSAFAQRTNSTAIPVRNSMSYELQAGLSVSFNGNAFANTHYWSLIIDTTGLHWPKLNGYYLPQISQDYFSIIHAISQLTPGLSGTINSNLQNQLYRVEIHQGGDASQATFKWSRDNASVCSQIRDVRLNTEAGIVTGGQFTITTLPPDGISGFNINQWLELTTPVREFENKLGDMVQITKISGSTVTVSGEINTDIVDATQNPIARRWDTVASGNLAVNSVKVGTEIAIENGLTILFSGNDFSNGDYWLIPTRASNYIDWPVDEVTGMFLAQPPQGIQHGYAPLAIVQRSNGVWNFKSDARTLVTPLSWLDVIGVDPGAPADTIHVDKYGQVGISTDTPGAKLDVETSAAMVAQDALHAIATSSNGIAIQAMTNDNMAADFTNKSTGTPTVRVTNNGDGYGLVTSVGTGVAAVFENKSQEYATIYVENAGDEKAAYFGNYSARIPTIIVENLDVQSAGQFLNQSDQNTTLNVENSGNNIAGTFINHGSQYPALWAENRDSGGPASTFVNASTTSPTIQVTNTENGQALETRGDVSINGGLTVNSANETAAILQNNSALPTLQLTNSSNGQVLQANGNTILNGSADINGDLTISNTNGGSFSLTPAPNKIPVADQSGHINSGWILENSGLRIIRGSVNGNLNGLGIVGIKAGSGFSLQRIKTGVCKVNFIPPFTTRPSGSATQLYSSTHNSSPYDDMTGQGNGATMDNAVIMGIDNTAMIVLTGNSDHAGDAANRDFEFIVIGSE